MVVDLAVSLLVILAGSIGMLLLLLLWFGDGSAALQPEGELDLILDEEGQRAVHNADDPFIPMPDHLKTRDEMVAWMTKELPKLTAGASRNER